MLARSSDRLVSCLGCPVRVSEVTRIGKRLKLNEFTRHKKKMKKLLDREKQLWFTGCS
jgi:hypothetical protein